MVIDVNTGKYSGKKTLQETILKINLEAAVEIAHQIRLRNLSGIILVDFIDMEPGRTGRFCSKPCRRPCPRIRLRRRWWI